MKIYTLKLSNDESSYILYDGSSPVEGSEAIALFSSDGEGYFTFDFNSFTPAYGEISITLIDDTPIIYYADDIQPIEGRNYKASWTGFDYGEAPGTFDSFTLLSGVNMDEAQLNELMGKIKNAGSPLLTNSQFNEILEEA